MPDIRFIDYRYRDLFKLPDGENIVITTIDGTKKLLKCCYLDEMHAKIGNNIYHIAQFAEFTRENGIIYRPENPKQEEEYAIYEIRQIKDGLTIEYKFADYERAKNKINPLHYERVYAGMLAKSRTLEDIFYEHNQESRPFRFKIHSLSTSDIIVVTRKDNKTAYYVDNLGFKELPEFAKALTEKPPKQKNDYQR